MKLWPPLADRRPPPRDAERGCLLGLTVGRQIAAQQEQVDAAGKALHQALDLVVASL